MILDALIFLAVAVGNFILQIFPQHDGFPQEFTDGVSTFSGYLANLSPVLPYGTILSVVSLVLLYQFTVMGFNGIKWFMSHIPFIGGKGV